MEEEINELLNTTSLTDIILKYDVIDQKIHKLEKSIIDICNVVNEKTKKVNQKNKDMNKLSDLKKVLDTITDEKIKELSIEELIEKYKLILNLCGNH